MDKEVLFRVEKTIQDIKAKLLLNEEIRKLLFYESKYTEDGEELWNKFDELEVPTVATVKDNIFTQPVLEIDNNPPFNKKIFIAITSPSMTFTSDAEVEHAIKVTIMVDKTDWVYNEKCIRAYHLAQEVVNELDEQKFACAGNLILENIMETILDKTIAGKSMIFSLVDGIAEKEGE